MDPIFAEIIKRIGLSELAMALYAGFHAVHFIMCHCETQVPSVCVLKKAGRGCFSVSFGIKLFTH